MLCTVSIFVDIELQILYPLLLIMSMKMRDALQSDKIIPPFGEGTGFECPEDEQSELSNGKC